MDKTVIDFAVVCDRINALIAENQFHNSNGKKYNKYILLSTNEADTSIVVLDRENGYVAYSIPYIASQTDEDVVVSLDFENKQVLKLGATGTTDSEFNVAQELDTIITDTVAYELTMFNSNEVSRLQAQLKEVTQNCEDLKMEIEGLRKHLAVYDSEKQQYEAKKHKDIIDAIIESRRDEMGKFSEYLEYLVNVDYSKSTENIEKELKEIHYNFLQLHAPKNKAVFSAINTEVLEDNSTNKRLIERYGEDIAKHLM